MDEKQRTNITRRPQFNALICLLKCFLTEICTLQRAATKDVVPFFRKQTPWNPVNFPDKNISTEDSLFSQGDRITIHRLSKRRTALKPLSHKSTPPTTATSIIPVNKLLETAAGIVPVPFFS